MPAAAWRAAGFALALWVAVAPAMARECGPLRVQAVQGAGEDEQRVCEAGASAAKFLISIGIRLPKRVTVQVEDALPAYHGVRTYGTFDAQNDHVRVLSLAGSRSISGQQRPFDLEMDERLYMSILVHELTHALVDEAFKPGCTSLRAHEYIAYVAQLATMSPDLRAEALERYPLDPFDDPEISDLYYAFDPHAFGVKAWLHFNRSGKGADFVHRVLNCALQPGQRPR